MGQHRYNPTAQAAARGELPPKPPKTPKRELERRMYSAIAQMTGQSELIRMLGGKTYG